MRDRKGFTLIEVLAVIVILVLIFLISQVLIGNMVSRVQAEACLSNMRSMEKAAYNYVTLEEDEPVPGVGEEIEIALVRLMNRDYITPVYDPATKQLVDLYESKVIIKNEINGPEFEAYISSPTCSKEGGELENPEETLGEELLWDGWMKMTLFYPESSIYREWRLSEEGEMRSDPLLMWQAYEGPILVPLDKTGDVWIRYVLDDQTITVPPAGKFLVDINANPKGPSLTNQVTISITFDSSASVKEYRVGNSGWIPYEGSFVVTENTMIEARGSKEEEIYDQNGNLLMVRTLGGRDSLYINHIGVSEENLTAPTITRTSGQGGLEVARIQVSYPGNATRTVYKINYGSEIEYQDEIPITRYGTHVIAYYYDSTGKRSLSRSIYINDTSSSSPEVSKTYTPLSSGTPATQIPLENKPQTMVPAPTISVSPTTVGTTTTVTVNAPEDAEKLYIKLGRYGSYQVYTNPVQVHKNMDVYAYYISSGGYPSDTGVGRVSNIREDSKPYLRIDATPYPYSGKKGDSSVTITLVTQDAQTVEYSLDGIVYTPYTTSFTVTENRRIYARAVNGIGETKEYLTITNIGTLQTPPAMKKLDVAIHVIPESIGNERFASVNVNIDFDSKATAKYYRLGNTGTLIPYTGEFTINSNTTVYAYATGVNAKGETSKKIDSLLTGISEPKIRIYPAGEASKVTVQIDFDKYATTKRYRLNNGTWLDYSSEFIIDQNETKIDAYNQNINGERKESTYTITSIIPSPPVVMIDKGSYFVLKLNYPPQANEKEYKFKEDGQWKTYTSAGILLIKSQYKDQLLPNGNLIQIENENGNMVSFTGDYYVLDVPISDVLENIFMRWDKEVPAAPTILLSTTSPTKEVDVTISYPTSAVRREYKIVKPNGESTGYISYQNTFKVTDKDTVVYARTMNSSEVWSTESMLKITNIDRNNPTITLLADLETPSRTLGIKVNGTDDTGIALVKWAPDERDANYFKNNGATIPNNSIFVVLMNGTYSVYVEDQVGNFTVQTITITNIDNEAPNIEITTDPAFAVSSTIVVSVDYEDSTQRQYKVGASNSTWSNYTESFTLTSKQVLDNNWRNEDGTVTIYARGRDGANNEITISKKILNLDLEELSILQGSGVIQTLYNYTGGNQNVNLEINGEIYPAEIYRFTENVVYQTTPILCDSVADERMCVLIYEGNLSVNTGVILTPQTRKKGFTIIVKGTLTNQGNITMNSRGANALGQNVYIWELVEGLYEYIPAQGGSAIAGGRQTTVNSSSAATSAPAGLNGSGRQTGGGGPGAGRAAFGGGGSAGTSYSGGTGGGGGFQNQNGLNGAENGGAGGAGRAGAISGWTVGSGGGAGNPGGANASSGQYGETGTGGLLILFVGELNNQGTISSNGNKGGNAYRSGGGGSGGGSINIFYQEMISSGTITATGGARGLGTRNGENSHGGAGGNGTVTLMKMK